MKKINDIEPESFLRQLRTKPQKNKIRIIARRELTD